MIQVFRWLLSATPQVLSDIHVEGKKSMRIYTARLVFVLRGALKGQQVWELKKGTKGAPSFAFFHELLQQVSKHISVALRAWQATHVPQLISDDLATRQCCSKYELTSSCAVAWDVTKCLFSFKGFFVGTERCYNKQLLFLRIYTCSLAVTLFDWWLILKNLLNLLQIWGAESWRSNTK